MRIQEIEKIKSIRNWADAQADAESKGLKLSKEQYTKGWYLAPANYDVISKDLNAKGLSWTDYYELITKRFNRITEYSGAAAYIIKNMGSVPQILAKVLDNKREKAYNTLQDLQEASLHRRPHGVPQLFVPRPKIQTEKPPWYYTRFAYDDEGNELTEARPILSPAPSVSKAGGTKPGNAFWTSSLKKEYEENGITYYGSEWIDYVSTSLRDSSYNDVGYVYRISPSARILSINHDEDVKYIYRIYRDLGANLTPHAEFSGEHYDMAKDFPWDEIRKHWDAIHHRTGWGDSGGFTYGYDCESTAWFNTDVLDYVGKVRIRDPDKDKNYWDNRAD